MRHPAAILFFAVSLGLLYPVWQFGQAMVRAFDAKDDPRGKRLALAMFLCLLLSLVLWDTGVAKVGEKPLEIWMEPQEEPVPPQTVHPAPATRLT